MTFLKEPKNRTLIDSFMLVKTRKRNVQISYQQKQICYQIEGLTPTDAETQNAYVQEGSGGVSSGMNRWVAVRSALRMVIKQEWKKSLPRANYLLIPEENARNLSSGVM